MALLLAAAVSGWWMYGVDEPAGDAQAEAADDYDYFLSFFELVEMDDAGLLKHTLNAENLYHYPERELSTLKRPRLVFYDDSRKAWEITAEQGMIHEIDRSVQLSGEVHIQYASLREGHDFEIHTDELYVWPDQRRAETGEPVRIEQQQGVTWSTGMRAELDRRVLNLLSDVRGRYEP